MKLELSTWMTCDDNEAWGKIMPDMLQVELLRGWSIFCLKNPWNVTLFLWDLYFLAEPNNGYVFKRWIFFYCTISKVVQFQFFCSYHTAFALPDFLFCSRQTSAYSRIEEFDLESFERQDFFLSPLSPLC